MTDRIPLEAHQIYLAAPWFNESQRERYDNVLLVLNRWKNTQQSRQLYIPRDLPCPIDADSATRRTFYESNIAAIQSSQLVVAITDGKDIGTIYELGYAACLRESGKSLHLCGVALTLGDNPFNLMLAAGLDCVCVTLTELSDYLMTGRVSGYLGDIE